ncbi:MAG: radical SAM protein [Elusimicrobia bacterium]|nr:radical SAM protein [Elusimicrobiota bacterium]
MRRLRIAVGSRCNMRCSYCLAQKEPAQRLKGEKALRVLSAFMRLPGRGKSVEVYGGEPTLELPLLRSLFGEARRLERVLGKKLGLSLATNGLCLGREALEIIARHRVRLCVSVDGASHDRFRRLPGGGGTLARIERGLEEAFRLLPRSGMTALQAVHPGNVDGLLENFKFVLGLGFENVNFEMIQGQPWGEGELACFEAGMRRVGEFLVEGIRRGRPAYLETLNAALGELLGRDSRPDPIELYPSGRLGLTPYVLLGRAASGRESACEVRVLEARQRLSRRLARQLAQMAARDPAFARYAAQASWRGRAP